MEWATSLFAETTVFLNSAKATVVRLRQNDPDGLQLVYSNAAPRVRRKHSARDGAGVSTQLLEEQIAAISAERDSLQRSLFEAAQVQRRLCSRHRGRDAQYEVAGELFPV